MVRVEAVVRAEDMLAAAMVRVEPRRFTYRGQELVRDGLSRKTLRVCPHCLRRDIAEGNGPRDVRPFGRATWLIEPLRTCPQHRSELVVVSDDMHPQRLHDFAQLLRPELHRLDDLCDAAGERAPSALENYLIRRLDGANAACWLDTLPFHAAAKSCEVIGAVSISGGGIRANEVTDSRWHRAGAEGYRILARGRDGVRELLERLQAASPGDRLGKRSMCGRVHEWLSHDTADIAYEPLRVLLRDAAADIMPLAAGQETFGGCIEVRRTHSIRSASLEFGVHPKRLRKLLHQAGFINNEAMSFSDERTLFPAEATQDFLGKVSRSMSLREARDYLHLPRPLERKLLEAGILVPFLAGTKDTINHTFDRLDLDNLLAKLLLDAQPCDHEKRDFVSVSKAATRACVATTDVVTLLLDRRLTNVYRLTGEEGFAAIRVDPAEVLELLKVDSEFLSLRQVEQRLKSSSAVVKALVDLGHLRSRTVVNPLSRLSQRVVAPDDLDTFMHLYVSASNLASERATAIKQVTAKLRSLGVEPAFDPALVHATFFGRETVRAVEFT